MNFEELKRFCSQFINHKIKRADPVNSITYDWIVIPETRVPCTLRSKAITDGIEYNLLKN